jgi:hypothetical protein
MNANQSARLATLTIILETIVPNFLQPVPNRLTVKRWLDDARIPRFKANVTASRGGGVVYYSVPAVEKFFRARIMA